jgi:hypothetical protein
MPNAAVPCAGGLGALHGRHRWTIERTGAWLGGFRRLRIRYERSSERLPVLVLLACSIICFAALQQPREVRLPVSRDVGGYKKSASAG